MLRLRSYSDLPEEIELEILSRVPAKSIGLFRCVSKSWRAMLSDPNFIKTHLQMSKINALESLLISSCSYPNSGSTIYSAPLNNAHHLFDEITLSLTKISFDDHYFICGSCDGLLLARDYQGNIFVMNPVTREITQVPHLPLARARDGCFYRKSVRGFGYDSARDDYKIITISFLFNYQLVISKDSFMVDVYSLKTRSWKRLESTPYDYIGSRSLVHGVFVGDCLYWLASRAIDNKIVIVAFSLCDEKFLEIPPPGFGDDLHYKYKLVALGDCLCGYSFQHGQGWAMKKYGVSESWTKFMVDKCYAAPFSFECFLNSQEQVVMESSLHDHLMWNPKQGTWKKIVFNGFNGSSLNIPHVKASFVESLISPHGSNKTERV